MISPRIQPTVAAVAIGLCIGGLAGSSASAGGSATGRAELAPAASPQSAWAQSAFTPQPGNWQPYVLSPSTRLVRPASVLSSDPRSGSITGSPAAALVTDGNTVRLTNSTAGRTGSPLVTFDFGQEVGGKVRVDLAGASDPPPRLHACFSESQQYMSSSTVESQEYPYAPHCDTANYNNGYSATYTYDSDSHTLTLPASYPGTATDSQLRGGFRYLTLFLDGVGSVDVDGVAVDFTNAPHQGANPASYAGWFLSSDDLLNRIWYASAYTVQLDTDSSGTAKSWPYVAGGSTTLARAAGAGDTNIKVASAGIFSRDGTVTLDSGANVEKAVVASVGTAASSTTLVGPALPGDTNIKVQSVSNLIVGGAITVGTVLPEQATVTAVGTAGATGTGVTLSSGLANPHAIGESVAIPGTGITLKAPLGLAHASGVSVSEPGEIDHADAQVPHADPNADVIFDGAKRDRIVWQGDLSVQEPVTLLSTGDVSAVENSLSSLAAQQLSDGYVPAESLVGPHNQGEIRTYGEYVNWFVNNMYEHWLYTGDLPYLQQWWTALQSATAWMETQRSTTTGLLAYPSSSGHYGYGDGGHETYLSALYKRNLDQMAAMATAVGDSSDATTYAARSQAVATAINGSLWDSAAGAYWLSSETHGQHPQDGNAMAIVAGVADPARAAQVLSFLKANDWSTYGSLRVPGSEGNSPISQAYSPLPTGFEAEARLLTAGQEQSALDLIRTYWGYQLSQDPHSTWWEHITTAGLPSIASFTSLAHGWASAPTVLLTQYVLGVSPTGPGYATFSVIPHPGDVQWAQGRVPAAVGSVDAYWTHGADSFCLTVDSTTNTGSSGEVGVPRFGSDRAITVNGQAAWDGSSFLGSPGIASADQDSDYVYFRGVQPGNRTFCWGTPTAAVVRQLTVRRTAHGTVLRWSTANEVDVLGFDVYRNGRKLNRTLIAAKQSGRPSGAAYRFLDRRGARRGRVVYGLEVVGLSGTHRRTATIEGARR